MAEIHPLTTPGVYAQAERAAMEAFAAANTSDGARLMELMDQAGEASLRRSGCSPELASHFAFCITADILEREPPKRNRDVSTARR